MTRQKLAEQTATINDAGTYVGSGGTGATWSEAFVYDTRSNLTQRTDARGVKTNISYLVSSVIDPLNRLQGISYDTSTADTTYTINAAPAVSFEYMTTGDKTRVKKVITSGVSTEENAFDSEGRIAEYKMTLDSRTSYPFETDYTYDSAHRLTQVDYPKAYGMTGDPRKAVVPSYDIASRLTQLNVDSATYLDGVSYNTSSQVTQLTTGSSMSYPRVENYTYDSQTGLLTGQTVKDTGATSTYLDLTYTYARGNSYGSASGTTGQLTKIVDNLNHNRDKLYEFDAVGRMKYAKAGTSAGASGVTANWVQSYSYDRYGNKTGVSVTGNLENTTKAPRDGLSSVSIDTANNRVNTSGWEYDLAGNLIRGKDGSAWQKFEYDAAGRLVKIKNDSNVVLETYTYGASRERLMTETSSLRRYYAWGGQNVVAEYTETATTPAYEKAYIYAGSRHLMTTTKTSSTTEAKEFQHPNRLGTQLVTDGGAGTSYHQSTMPFGTLISTETTGTTNQVFTSYDRSSTTGLDYATNRTYSKGQSRFTQVDPIGMNSASLGNPQSNNLYSYVRNMPTDFVDPSGLQLMAFTMTICNRWERPEDRVCVEIVIYWMNIGGGGDVSIGDVLGAVNERLDTGKCREKLNALLDQLKKKPKDKKTGKTGFDAIVANFFDGGRIDFSKSGISNYDTGTGRITLNVDPSRGANVVPLTQILSTEFIHEGLHGASGGGLTHKDIMKAISKLEGTSFSDLEKERKALKGKNANDSSLYEQPMNEWINKNCPATN